MYLPIQNSNHEYLDLLTNKQWKIPIIDFIKFKFYEKIILEDSLYF